MNRDDFASIYSGFQSTITKLNCGKRCASYNENRVPFCCDTSHAVPSAYKVEWEYLKSTADQWYLWQGGTAAVHKQLNSQVPEGQVLIACQGNLQCQRDFRSLSCRSFPFFPYFTQKGVLTCLCNYREYKDRCWVISNFLIVSSEFLSQSIGTYKILFENKPAETDVFRAFSALMQRNFTQCHQSIPVIHRNGYYYEINPRNGRMCRAQARKSPKFGDYKIATQLPFPDEVAV
jgi:hypothetical protein